MRSPVSHLDILRIDPRARRLGRVEGEGDAADLREPALKLRPHRHPILQGVVDHLAGNVKQDELVHHGEDGEQVPEDELPRHVLLVTPQGARVEESTVSIEGGHHDVRDQVAQVGLSRTNR